MSKSFIAIAGLAASGAAMAQSSVTLFGVADAAVSYYSTKSVFYYSPIASLPPVATPIEVGRSQTALSSGGNASSRFGFRGVEDLGGGLAASFWLEAGFNLDTGLIPNAAFARRSTVSLSGSKFGEVRLGRDYVPTYWNESVFDPMGAVGVGENLLKTVSGSIAIARGPGSPVSANDNAVRASNSIGYFLPRDLAGFYGQVMYALPENVDSSIVPGSPSTKGRYYGGRFGYTSGPLDVAVAYGESQAADTTALTPAGLATGARFSENLRTVNLGASYDFGILKLMGELSQVRDSTDTVTPIRGVIRPAVEEHDNYNGAMIGMTVPVGAGMFKASVARVNFDNDLGAVPPGTPSRDASASKLALGYVHNLSKRTALYATVAHVRVKDGQNNPAIMGVAAGSLAYITAGAAATGLAPKSSTGYDFGLRHSF
ncbi:porin [Variovorax saccharolyticus]|uniref:porin n=1 Tax=Variovorax saccharolyticus TaxID=3053516 RepID=UPI002577C67E|nr:porin [Variovorax sp. J22R187]MDM0018999.1 porin [Variovorax sp. J22R187]